MTGAERWRHDGWRGWRAPGAEVDAATCLAALATRETRRSRHARTLPLDTAGGRVFVKLYPAPDGWRAARAARMGAAVAAAGFGAPVAVLCGRAGRRALLVTRDAGGADLATAVTALAGAGGRPRKRRLLRALGAEVGRLHAAGFLHGDLVPTNVHVVDDGFVFLDHDRTRRARLLVWWGARRNLVQLGRFVVPGVSVTDRARVLCAYAAARGLGERGRRRLAAWVATKIVTRRAAVDGIPLALAMAAGFRTLMRSGGPYDPAASTGAGGDGA